MIYLACGHLIESSVPLGGVTPAEGGRPEFIFTLRRSGGSVSAGAEVHRWTIDRSVWLRIERLRRGYALHFPGLASFLVSPDGRIECDSEKGTPRATLVHLFLNQVLPLVLSARGGFVLHGSAVEIAGASAAFLGPTGRGKSTLAASFVAHGARPITDDCLVVDPVTRRALPCYPSLRLWPESLEAVRGSGRMLGPAAHYTSKQRLFVRNGERFDHTPVPLGPFYFLGTRRRSRIAIEALSAHEAFLELVKHSFILDPQRARNLKSQFRSAARLARFARAFRLSYPRDFARLPEVRAAIAAHAALLSGKRASQA
jgi:hypothetical protein